MPTGAVIHDRQVLHETWQERAREIVPARNRDVARGRNGVGASAFLRSEARAPLSTLSVVRRAVEHLEERRTMFSANDLCAGMAILTPTHELRAEINTAVRHGLEDGGVAS